MKQTKLTSAGLLRRLTRVSTGTVISLLPELPLSVGK
jgi:hypothetical protein